MKNIRRNAWIGSLLLLLLSGGGYGCSSDNEEISESAHPLSISLESTNPNLPGGGTLTAMYADAPKGQGLARLVDGNVTTKFTTFHARFHLIWQAKSPFTLTGYSLTSADETEQNDPKAWVLSGSQDGLSWTVLDSRSNQRFEGRMAACEYETDNTEAYLYYKLEITENQGGSATQLAEWALLYIPETLDDLMPYATGHTFTAVTPMGTHYLNRHITTDEDRAWLAEPSNEPAVPASASHLHYEDFVINQLYPFGVPSPADINQHSIGDCSALAVFASLAYIYPDFVKKLIEAQPDGTYQVAMFDPQGNPVKVAVTSRFLVDQNGHIGAVSGKHEQVTWATVLEKAIMKYNAIYQVNPDIGGIGSEHVAPLFTGNGSSFAFAPGRLTNVQLSRAAKVSLRQGRLMVGGFTTADLPIGELKTVTGHAYTVMHTADRNALFAMRNPWGTSPGSPDGKEDGVLNIPNNQTIPPTIDFRIMESGIAGVEGLGIKFPYVPPVF